MRSVTPSIESAVSRLAPGFRALSIVVESAPVADPAVAEQALAEACRNPSFARIVQDQGRGIRRLLVDFLAKAQQRGDVDPGLDPEATANILVAIVDGARALPIRNPAADIKQSTDHLRIMITRFLRPPARREPAPADAQRPEGGGN